MMNGTQMDAMQSFHEFFGHCVGNWSTERTYHYLTHQEVERSHTEFNIHPLVPDQKAKVLSDNAYPPEQDLDPLPGFHLAFETVSEHGEKVGHALNMLFVTQREESGALVGDYLRDRAYEESKPMIAQFRFTPKTRELLMTTTYTRIISVDSITLVNPSLRIRRILNYHRPADGESLRDVALAGFGVEQKVASA
ncbi:MAG: phycobiliprotein lyase [Cyanobacteria bacterium J06638_22]